MISFLRNSLIFSFAWILPGSSGCFDPSDEPVLFACSQTQPQCPDNYRCNPKDYCCHREDYRFDENLGACRVSVDDPHGTTGSSTTGSTSTSSSTSMSTSSSTTTDTSSGDTGETTTTSETSSDSDTSSSGDTSSDESGGSTTTTGEG